MWACSISCRRIQENFRCRQIVRRVRDRAIDRAQNESRAILLRAAAVSLRASRTDKQRPVMHYQEITVRLSRCVVPAILMQ